MISLPDRIGLWGKKKEKGMNVKRFDLMAVICLWLLGT